MPQSLARVVLHIVFSTKHRQPFLRDKNLREELYAYMAAILKAMESPAIKINGVEDHVHVLCNLSRNYPIKKIVEELKKEPSKWIKTKGPQYQDFYWQNGYGAFSVSPSNVPEVKAYVIDQEQHHQRMTYQDEFRALCKKHDLDFDERYVWD